MEVGVTEVGVTEVGVTEVGGMEVGVTEVGVTEVGGMEVGGMEVDVTEVGGMEVGGMEVGARLVFLPTRNELHCRQRSGEIGWRFGIPLAPQGKRNDLTRNPPGVKHPCRSSFDQVSPHLLGCTASIIASDHRIA